MKELVRMLPKELEVKVLEAVEQYIGHKHLEGKVNPTQLYMLIYMMEQKVLEQIQ